MQDDFVALFGILIQVSYPHLPLSGFTAFLVHSVYKATRDVQRDSFILNLTLLVVASALNFRTGSEGSNREWERELEPEQTGFKSDL